jgi:tRNA G10  N-methylase Trm11
LIEDLISRVFHPGCRALLLDPFVGSGAILVAARRFPGISAFGYEIDPTHRERAVAYLVENYLTQKAAEEAEDL